MQGEPSSSGNAQVLKHVKYRGHFMECMNAARVSRSQNLVKESRYVISRSETLMTLADALVMKIRIRRANG